MEIELQNVEPEDILELWRQKDNANGNILKQSVNSLINQQAAHVGAGHPALNYTKTETDAAISAEATSRAAADTTLQNNISAEATSRANADTALQGNIDSEAVARNAAMATVAGALTTHKSSGDHDARYLAAALLTTIMRLTGDQSIDGLKIFLQKIIVKKANPNIELQHSDGSPLVQLIGQAGTAALLALQLYDGGYYKTVLDAHAGRDYVEFPNHYVYAKGQKIATEEYANALLDNVISNSYVTEVWSGLVTDENGNVDGSEDNSGSLITCPDVPIGESPRMITCQIFLIDYNETFFQIMYMKPNCKFDGLPYQVYKILVFDNVQMGRNFPIFKLYAGHYSYANHAVDWTVIGDATYHDPSGSGIPMSNSYNVMTKFAFSNSNS